MTTANGFAASWRLQPPPLSLAIVAGLACALAIGKTLPLPMDAVANVLARFNAERLDFCTKLSTWPAFGKGWARRVAGNLKYAAEDA